MPIYRLQAPDGNTYRLEAPDGTSQDDLAAALFQQHPEAQKPNTEPSLLKTIGANLAGGAADAGLGFGAAAADYTGASDTAKYLDDKRAAVKDWQKKNGGDSFTGMAAAGAGSMSPALGIEAAGAAFAPETLGASIAIANVVNAGFFGVPAFRDTYKEQKASGASDGVAIEQALAAAGWATIGGKLIGTGGKILPKSLQAGEKLAAKMGMAAGEGAVFPEAGRVTEKTIDAANSRDNDKPWLVDAKEAAAGAASFAALRGAHHVMEAPKRAQEAADKTTAEQAEADRVARVAQGEETANTGPQYTPEMDLPDRPSQQYLQDTIAQAQEDRLAALQKAAEAGRNGDTATAREAQKEADKHAATISDYTPLLDGTVPPKSNAPEPTVPTPEEDAARLVQLQGGVNRKGKPVAGLHEKAVLSGDTEKANAHLDEIDQINARMADAQQRAAEAQERAKGNQPAQDRLAQLSEEEGSTTVPPPERPAPTPPVEPPPPPVPAGQLTGKTREQMWREQNQEQSVDDDTAAMQAARMNTGKTEQTTLFPADQGPTGIDRHKDLRDSLVNRLRRAMDAGENDDAERVMGLLRRLGMTDSSKAFLSGTDVPHVDVTYKAGADLTPTEMREKDISTYSEKDLKKVPSERLRDLIRATGFTEEELRSLSAEQLAKLRKANPSIFRSISDKAAADAQRKLRGEDTTVDDLRAQIESLPARMDPYAEHLVGRLHNNIEAFAADPVRAAEASEWLHRLRTGSESGNGRVDSRGSEYVRNELDNLNRAKISETQQVVERTPSGPATPIGTKVIRNQQGDRVFPQSTGMLPDRLKPTGEVQHAVQKDMFPDTEHQGRIFSTPALFNQFLASEALHKMRSAMGHTVQTVARAMKRIAPMQAKLERLESSLKDAQDAYSRHASSYAGLTEKAQAAHASAQKRLADVEHRLMLEREPVVVEYLKAQEALKFSADVSRDITQAILDNKAMLHESMPGTIEALVREKQAISDTISKQMQVAKDTSGKTAKEVYAHVEQLQHAMATHMLEVQRLTTELAAKRSGFPAAFETYLQKERSFQKQWFDEQVTMRKLHKTYCDVKTKFDLLEKNQNRRVTVKRERAAAQDAIRQTADNITATESAAERQRRIDADTAAGKHDKAQEVRNEITSETAPVEAARDSRLPKEDSEGTPSEREAEDGRKRAEAQAALERAEATPTVLVSFKHQREMRDFLNDAPRALAELQRQRTDAETGGGDVASLTTRINKIRAKQAEYTDRMTATNEANTRLDERIAKKQEQVDRIKESLQDSKASKKTLANRKDELTKAETALDRMREARSGNRGVERTDVTRDKLDTEAPVEGERLAPRKLGPVVKKETNPGDSRTGSAESKSGDNKTGSRNPIRQSGQARGVTAHQAIAEGNRVSAERESQRELAQQQQEAAATANAEAEKLKAAPKPKPVPPKKSTKATAPEDITPEKAKTSRVIEENNDYGDYEDNYYDPSGFGGGWDGEHESIAMRTADEKAPGMDKADVERHVEEQVAGWKNAPEVQVVQSISDLPLRAQGRIIKHKEGADGRRVPGYFDRKTGKVILIADELRGIDDASKTVLHEIAGHHGLKGVLGDTYKDTMQRLYDGNKDVAAKAREQMAADPELTVHDAVEEVLAYMAERQPKSTAVARFFFAIKAALFKKFGLKHVANGEVAQIVENARRYVEGNGPSGPEGGGKRTPDEGSDVAMRTAAEELGREYQDKRTALAKLNASKSHLPLALEQAMVDMRAALRRTFALGNKDLGTQANYDLLNADNYIGNTHNVLSDGALALRKDKVNGSYDVVTSGNSKSFKDVLESVSDMPGKNAEAKMDAFYGGMMALRAQRAGWHTLDAKDPAKAQRMGEAALREINADPKAKAAFDKARDTYHDYNRGLVEFARDTHAITPELAKELLANKDYVPYYRVDGDTINMMMPDGHPVSMGDIRSQPFLHALVGGEQKLMSFQDAVFRNTAILTNLATRNLASKRIAYHLQDLGKGAKVMQIQRGKGGAGQDVMRFRQKPDPKIPEDDGWRHIVINTKGTAAEHIPSDLLAQSVAGTYATLPSMLKAFGAASDLLRSGVTRMPTYILSQTIKDPFNASMMGNLKANPVMAALKTVKGFSESMLGKSADAENLRQHGVLHSNIFNGSEGDMRKMGMQIAGKNQSMYRRFLGGLDHAAMTADAATREQHYRDVLASGGSELEAVVGAREMQNFAKRGSSASVQMMSRMIPFFNASIQGLNVIAKSAQGKMTTSERLASKGKFYRRAAGLASMAVVYAMSMEDDPEWQKMSLRDKLSYIHLPKWMSPTDEAMRIPAPFESGMLFYSLPIAMVEGMRSDFSPKDWQVVRDLFMNQLPGSGSVMPQIAKGAYDVSRNYNSGTGQTIEPRSVAHLASQERTVAGTTEAAKRFSEQLNSMGVALSPIQIEYLANSYVGQLPQTIATLTNQQFAKAGQADVERPAGHASDTPFLGRFFQNTRGTDDIEHMYEAATQSVEAKDTFKHMIQQGRGEEAKAYLEEHQAEIATEKAAAKFTSAMQKFKKVEDAVRGAPRATPQEKQETLDRIQEGRRKVAEAYRTAVTQVTKQTR